MVRRRLAVMTVSCALLLTTVGCAPGTESEPGERWVVPSLGPSSVKLDTPELRKIKADAGIETCRPGTGAPVTGGAPDLVLPCLGGGPEVNLASLRGPLIVNVWSVRCDPCRDEMPILQSFFESHGETVDVLGIDLSDTFPDAALKFAKESGVTYPLVADFGGDTIRSQVLRAPLLPTTTFIDKNGKVTHSMAAEIKSEQELVDLVNKHLGLNL